MTTPDAIAGMVAALQRIHDEHGGDCGDEGCVSFIAGPALAAWRDREPLAKCADARRSLFGLLGAVSVRQDDLQELVNPILKAIDAALFGPREPERKDRET
jgi:hypothetical protein